MINPELLKKQLKNVADQESPEFTYEDKSDEIDIEIPSIGMNESIDENNETSSFLH